MSKIRIALYESHHQMPEEVEGAIFSQTIDSTDLLKIRVTCKRSLNAAVKDNKIQHLVVYVTGLTVAVALVEVINWCIMNKVHLTLMHFDKNTGEYYPQIVRGTGL